MNRLSRLTEGIILEMIDERNYRVKIIGGQIVLCTLSTKVKAALNNIEIGSIQKIELSPYDEKRGRITYR